MNRRLAAVALVAFTCGLTVACTKTSTTGAGTLAPVSGISVLPDDPSRPYGIVAINYHFHDAHPSSPLAPDRKVTWTNEGSVVHNVSFSQIGFSKDIAVGETIGIDALGKKLGGPGTYRFVCRYHESLGMIGTIVISTT